MATPCEGKISHSPALFEESAMALQYVSEVTDFFTELKASRPHIEADQKKGRAIWWDKLAVAPDEAAELRASRVAQKPYVYGSIKG